MRAWSILVILAALTAGYLLNKGQQKSVVPAPAEAALSNQPVQVVKPTAKVADEDQDSDDEDESEEETAVAAVPPASIAEPQEQLQPQPPTPEIPLWTPAPPKPRDAMWTLHEVTKADMSDRTLLLITYGKIPGPNFRIESFEPSILAPDEH